MPCGSDEAVFLSPAAPEVPDCRVTVTVAPGTGWPLNVTCPKKSAATAGTAAASSHTTTQTPRTARAIMRCLNCPAIRRLLGAIRG